MFTYLVHSSALLSAALESHRPKVDVGKEYCCWPNFGRCQALHTVTELLPQIILTPKSNFLKDRSPDCLTSVPGLLTGDV